MLVTCPDKSGLENEKKKKKEGRGKRKKKKQKQWHLLFHLLCFFMYKAAEINVLYTRRKEAHSVTAFTYMG